VILSAVALALALASCGESSRDSEADPPVRVAAAFYPLAEAAEAIGGERVAVTNLTPPGTGPHDLELGAKELERLEQADLLLHLGAGFQPAVEKAATSVDGEAVDLLESASLRVVDPPLEGVRGEVDGEVVRGDRDPHVWVDPVRYAALVSEVERALARVDPAGADTYARNGHAYRAKLARLDAQFEARLRGCATRTLVTSHAAFGYLADRYGLDQVPIAGISPEDEPDPKSLAATARRAKADGVKTVYFESLVPPALSETVAREIGARTDALDPVEGIEREALEAGEDYVSIQRDNLEALRKGLGCTGA